MVTDNQPGVKKPHQFNWSTFIFGYDFFISFKLGSPPIGAQSYASDLARRLRELGFTVFFSEEEAPPGAELGTTLSKALHSSKILVVLANEGALVHSKWVRKEVEEFQSKHPTRPVIPINFDKSIENFGLQSKASEWLPDESHIWLDETATALNTGIVTTNALNNKVETDIVKRLEVAFRFKRANRLWQGLQFFIITVITGLGLAAWHQAEVATRQAKISKSRQLASQSLVDLDKRPQHNLFTALESIEVSKEAEDFGAVRSSQLLTDVLAQTGGLPIEHTAPPVDLAISPDDRWLASASGKSVRIWKIGSFSEPAYSLVEFKETINAITFSPDGTTFAAAGKEGVVYLWDINRLSSKGKELKPQSGPIVDLAFSQDGQWLATATSAGPAQLWKLQKRETEEPKHFSIPETQAMAISPDNRWLATGSTGGQIALWNLKDDSLTTPARQLSVPLALRKLVFSPSNSSLVAAGTATIDKLSAFLIPMTASSQPIEFGVQQWSVGSVAFSPDGQWLATPNAWNFRLWNLNQPDPTLEPITLKGHKSETQSAVFSADGHWLATGNADFTIRLWNMRDTHEPPTVLRGHEGMVSKAAFSHGNRLLATASADNSVRLWNLSSPTAQPQYLATINGETKLHVWGLNDFDWVTPPQVLGEGLKDYGGTVVSADGRWIACISIDSIDKEAPITLWDLSTATPTRYDLPHEGRIWASPVFSPDSHWLITGGADDSRIRLWDLLSTNPSVNPKLLGRHEEAIRSFAISADNRRLVSGVGDNRTGDDFAKVWDLTAEPSSTNPLTLKAGFVKSVAISEDGRYVVTGNWEPENSAYIWDLSSETSVSSPIKQLKFQGRVFDVAISANGRWVGAGSLDGTAQVFDLSKPKGNPITFKRQAGQDFGWTLSVGFSPDSQWFATGYNDRTARLWNLEAPDPTSEAFTLNSPNKVGSLSFSPDGKWLALSKTEFRSSPFSGDSKLFASSNTETSLYHTRLEDLTQLACQTAGRNISGDKLEMRGYKICEEQRNTNLISSSSLHSTAIIEPEQSPDKEK